MDSSINRPTGGFPPIYLNTKNKDKTKNREFSSVPIKKIMDNRKNNVPFFVI